MYRSRGAAESPGSGGHCLSCYYHSRRSRGWFPFLRHWNTLKYPVVKSLTDPLFDSASVLSSVLTEELATE